MNLPNPDMTSTVSPAQAEVLLTWLDTTKAYVETEWQDGSGHVSYQEPDNERQLDAGYYAFTRSNAGVFAALGPYDTFPLALAALARKANGGVL